MNDCSITEQQAKYLGSQQAQLPSTLYGLPMCSGLWQRQFPYLVCQKLLTFCACKVIQSQTSFHFLMM